MSSGKRERGYGFIGTTQKAMERKHLNTMYGNRKKYCRELFQDHTKWSALLISSVSPQLAKYISPISLSHKKTFLPELHWAQDGDTELLTQQYKCAQQMSCPLFSSSNTVKNNTRSIVWAVGAEGTKTVLCLFNKRKP